MDATEIFPWSSNFESGLTLVDDQHKTLVTLLNQLAEHVVHKSDAPTLDAVFNELAAYATFHFQTEERIWGEYLAGDALESAHKTEHSDFRSNSRTRRGTERKG